MEEGSEAWWDGEAHTVTCLACKVEAPADPFAGVDADLRGVPGGSAQAEADRKAEAGHSRRSTEAWEKGSDGERRLFEYLHELEGQIRVLADRRIPGSRANIDLISVAPTGVYVIDAKKYQGKVQLRDTGFGRWRKEELIVRGRNCTNLVGKMEFQVAAVRGALDSADIGSSIPIHPVLCFVGAEWDLFFTAFTVNGVLVTAPRPLRHRLRKEGSLDATRRDQVARLLSLRLPSAVPVAGALAGHAARR